MKEFILVISDEVLEKTWEHPEDRPQELVRCKDCKHRYEYRTGSCPYFTVYGSTAPENWFCADGKRKEGVEMG